MKRTATIAAVVACLAAFAAAWAQQPAHVEPPRRSGTQPTDYGSGEDGGFGGEMRSGAYQHRSEVGPDEGALAAQIDKLVQGWKTVREEDRGDIQQQLRSALNRLFELRQQEHEREVEFLEAKVKSLREQLELRREKRDEIVEFRLQQLLREAEGLGWGPGPTGTVPGSAGRRPGAAAETTQESDADDTEEGGLFPRGMGGGWANPGAVSPPRGAASAPPGAAVLSGMGFAGQAAGGPSPADPAGDRQGIEVVWRVTSRWEDEKRDDGPGAKAMLALTRGRFIFWEGEQVAAAGTYALEPKADPPAINLVPEVGDEGLILGIYRLKGDTLRMAVREHLEDDREAKRPANFDPAPRTTVMVLRRVSEASTFKPEPVRSGEAGASGASPRRAEPTPAEDEGEAVAPRNERELIQRFESAIREDDLDALVGLSGTPFLFEAKGQTTIVTRRPELRSRLKELIGPSPPKGLRFEVKELAVIDADDELPGDWFRVLKPGDFVLEVQAQTPSDEAAGSVKTLDRFLLLLGVRGDRRVLVGYSDGAPAKRP